MEKASLEQKVTDLPRLPGVYLFKNAVGKVIYVGKAKSLKDRVKSYFALDIIESSKTAALVRNIVDLEFIEVMSELEALILEAELIKKYRPKYNIQLKDDKSSLYIVIRNERVKFEGKSINLPRVLTARETDLKKKDKVFGPYPQGSVAKYVVRSVRRIIPYRDCTTAKFQRYHNLGKPCFFGHLGLCSAPCASKVSIEDYKKEVKKVEKLLSGEYPSITKAIRSEMQELSKELRYEEAAERRDMLKKMEYVTKTFRDPAAYVENPYLVEDLLTEALDDLVQVVPDLKEVPRRIECYDISNISGREATGSMVVAVDGRIEKKEYRKFRIKLKATPDDFDMMREVLGRRFKRKGWDMPDLIVLDGGKGQVSAVREVLEGYEIEIPLIGLAKKMETVVLSDFSEVVLERGSEGLKLLQRLRDEAHRFAKDYHMKLRLKKLTEKQHK